MTIPRLVILTTEQEKFRLANSKRVAIISKVFKYRYDVVVMDELSEDLIDSMTYKDVIFVRSKDIALTEHAMTLKNKCRVIVENLNAIFADDNKEAFKMLCREIGIDTPKSYYDLTRMQYPVFVKPANLGDSIGINSSSLCYHIQEVKIKCSELITKYDAVPLVESYITGDEFTVAVLYHSGKCYTSALHLDCGEIGLTYNVKQQDTETLEYALDVDSEICKLAKRIADYLGITRMCRIDFIRDHNGRYFALEVNVFPGLGDNGYMFQALTRKFGWDYETFLINAILN